MAARILIVDETAMGRIAWRARLSAAHYRVTLIDGPKALAKAVSEARPDLIILAHRDLQPMLKLCKSLKEGAATANVAVVIAGPEAGPETRLAALAAGADELLGTPLSDAVCIARIRSLLRARDAQHELFRRRSTAEEFGFCEAGEEFERPGRIALVARSKTQAHGWRDALVTTLRDRIDVLGEHAALSTAGQETAADVYVIDISADRTDQGLRLLADLRAQAETRRASVLAVIQPGDAEAAAKALDLGAGDVVPSDFKPAELALRVKAQIRRKHEADMLSAAVEDGMRLAATDPLTGLYNRRYAMKHASRILAEAQSAGRPVSVLIADLDHFKRVNDTYGHAAGDTVLVDVAARLRANLRGADVLSRIGGEEFLIVMADTDVRRAGPAAARICKMIAARPIIIDDGLKSLSVTMSIGVAATSPGLDGNETIEALIHRADTALYDAKAAGRNQFTVAAAA